MSENAREFPATLKLSLKAVLDRVSQAVMVDDIAGRVVYANQAFLDMFEVSTDDVLAGLELEDYVDTEFHDELRARHEQRMRGETPPSQFRYRGVKKGGQRFWAEVTVREVQEQGKLVGTQSTIRDITEWVAVEQSVRTLRAALSGFPLGISVLDAEGRVLLWNRAAEQLFGWQAHEVLGNPFPLAPGQLQEQHRHVLERTVAGETIRGLDTKRAHKDGGLIPVEIWTVPMRDETGYVYGSLGVTIDQTKQRRTLRDHEYLLQHLHDAVLLFDAETEVVLEANRRACELYGMTREELVGSSLAEFSTGTRPSMTDLRNQDAATSTGYEVVHRRKDGALIHFEANAASLVYDGRNVVLSAARDVSERKQLEADLMQAQKLEAVGLLAAGVAHDFSNVLTSVLGAASMLSEELGSEHPGRNLVDEIKAGAERGAALTQRLMSFGRRQAVELEVLDLRGVVEQLTSWLRRIVEETVALNIVSSDEPALVFADQSQLEQIVLNLVLNARDAMPRGGTIEIETRCVDLDAEETVGRLRPGPYVQLRVTDTGQGMTEETLERAFTPFFTTKAPGRGTGLGLSTVRTIARQSGGRVVLQSQMGAGTTVEVWLPATAAPARTTPMSAVESPKAQRGAKVLVVEDEATVRRTAVRILKKAGYDVVSAASAEEARQRFTEHQIQVMVTDVMMPGESGPELARAMLRAEPGLRVAFMSGYVPEEEVAFGGGPFVQKPFTPQELKDVVATALAGAEHSNT